MAKSSAPRELLHVTEFDAMTHAGGYNAMIDRETLAQARAI
jgi:hypothetical protein